MENQTQNIASKKKINTKKVALVGLATLSIAGVAYAVVTRKKLNTSIVSTNKAFDEVWDFLAEVRDVVNHNAAVGNKRYEELKAIKDVAHEVVDAAK